MSELYVSDSSVATPSDALDRAFGPGTGWYANPHLHGVKTGGGVRVWIHTDTHVFMGWAQGWVRVPVSGRWSPTDAWVENGGRWVDAAGNGGPAFDADDAAAVARARLFSTGRNPVWWDDNGYGGAVAA